MSDRPRFDFAGVKKRARSEGRRAGRSHGLGQPLADSLELLAGRQWIRARFDEFVAEAERQLTTRRREHNAELEADRERLRELDRERHAVTALIADLAPAHAADVAKPRHQQNLALEYELGSAHARLHRVIAHERDLKIDLARQLEQLEEIEREFTAWPTRLREACDTAEHEHDIAYARARHAWWIRLPRRLLTGPGARLRLKRAET